MFANLFVFIYQTANLYIRSGAWSRLNEFFDSILEKKKEKTNTDMAYAPMILTKHE